jgi:hypothetical protein
MLLFLYISLEIYIRVRHIHTNKKAIQVALTMASIR